MPCSGRPRAAGRKCEWTTRAGPQGPDIRSTKPPIVNISIIAACIAVYVWELLALHQGRADIVYSYALVPRRLFSLHAYLAEGAAPVLSLITSMFLHGGFFHIGVNMLFLWVFGDNVEAWMGHLRYLLFYLLCGVLAGLLHAVLYFYSEVPTLGASGAIAGVMGAYVLLFPGARVRGLVPLFIFFFLADLPAWLFIGMWFFLQLFQSIGSILMPTGVAVFAHIGGFLAGLYLVRLFAQRPRRGPYIRRFEIIS